MHLNWGTKVTLPMYADAGIADSMTAKIRAATDDDLLSSFLHFTEGRVALRIYGDANLLLTSLRDEEEHAATLRRDDASPLLFEYLEANSRLKRDLSAEVAKAQKIKDEIGDVWHGLRIATTGNLNHRYRSGADPATTGLDKAGSLQRALDPMWQRLEAILGQHRDQTHGFALRDAAFQAFAATSDSVTPEQLDAMTPLEFEQAIAFLADRDGYTVTQRKGGARDLGADVIAVTPDGRKIVFQCKHRRPGGRPLGSPVIQTLNGTARPVHRADIVIAVTNASFTNPAHELANEQDIHLLWGRRLRDWAAWGVPLLTVLELESETALRAA
ncbi:restriction endonuclease [Streptomyces sp. NRRL S-1824]|uniref:restriction endonuclease n=1 Tax=Streptomyces sp. NRRL S-1824 TaxID=1463889 RepID=UPI00068A56A4|nr:restriction endonuclease [Streptomyces sp. NRRL S-1824]